MQAEWLNRTHSIQLKRHRYSGECHDIYWIARFYPRLKAACQGTHAGKAQLLELQRHTGAGGFARSSAVENQIAVFGNLG